MTKENKSLMWDYYGQIHELKQKLSETDYQAIKFAEGEMTIAEFSATKEQRKAWRSEINALETKIKALKG